MARKEALKSENFISWQEPNLSYRSNKKSQNLQTSSRAKWASLAEDFAYKSSASLVGGKDRKSSRADRENFTYSAPEARGKILCVKKTADEPKACISQNLASGLTGNLAYTHEPNLNSKIDEHVQANLTGSGSNLSLKTPKKSVKFADSLAYEGGENLSINSENLTQNQSENPAFLKEQILTYLGNKRALLGFIEQGVLRAKSELGREKISCVDLFSGSGVVARFLKRHASYLVANDLEIYSAILNECYLANVDAKFKRELADEHQKLSVKISQNLEQNFTDGFIAELYAPKDDSDIKPTERVFYTRQNARYIDAARSEIAKLPHEIQPFFIAPLLYEASNKANTSGVFKGFYKNRQGVGQFGGEGRNALKRITGQIALPMPVFSNFHTDFRVYRSDANKLARELDAVDLVYLDPPYNQHPYSSNYFMLNLIAKYERPSKISRVSGIEQGWNRSIYNRRAHAAEAFFELISALRAKFVLISYNCEGFITRDQFETNLAKFGRVDVLEQRYNTFRASRNLSDRNLHVTEFLYVLKK